MSRLWYVGDSWVDPLYTGSREHEGKTSWVQQLEGELGVLSVVNIACSGTSPDWALQQLCLLRHEWEHCGDDYMLLSFSDFSRLNVKSMPPNEQHNTMKHAKGKRVFREIHNSTWDFYRTTGAMTWIAAIAPYWRRVFMLTPFGIQRCGALPGKYPRQLDAALMMERVAPDNLWWFPRFTFAYDKMYDTGKRYVDGRPNHVYENESNSLLASSKGWFLNGEKNIYKPYRHVPFPEAGIDKY